MPCIFHADKKFRFSIAAQFLDEEQETFQIIMKNQKEIESISPEFLSIMEKVCLFLPMSIPTKIMIIHSFQKNM